VASSCTVTHPAEEEGHGIVRRGNVRAGVVVTSMVVAVSSCGTPAPTHTAPPTPSPTAASRPSAAAGPCASVTATMAIAEVPAACAAVWAPYGVTKVPPANLTDSVPPPPDVVNGTHGALSDAELKQWVLASNRDSLWYRWAEANDQSALLPRLGAMSLYPTAELQALAANESITQPDCALFPTKLKAFAISAADRQYFISRGQSVSDAYVFVGAYVGACVVTAMTVTGKTITIASYPTAGTTFFASHITNDPLVGPLLYADGAGSCADPAAPAAWCQA
jgi:hypothetical protein